MFLSLIAARWTGRRLLSAAAREEESRFEQRTSRFRAHLDFCVRHVPMYRDVELSGDLVADLRRFPIFPKREMNARDPSCLSHASRGARIEHTSGTSGQTFHYMITAQERSIRRRVELLTNDWLGLSPGETYLQIWGGHESTSIVKRVKNAVYGGALGRDLRVVSCITAGDMTAALREHARGVLITYPSILASLCDSQQNVELLAAFRSIILTGEAVDYRVFSRFGFQNLRNRYGSREFGVIAVADMGSLRYLDSRFHVEHDPALGILITDLDKKAMPMLRYPIGDFADPTYTDHNRCSSINRRPCLGRVEGRVIDTLIGRTGRRYVSTFWTLMMRDLGVSKFRIVLAGDHRLEVHFVAPIPPAQLAAVIAANVDGDFSIIPVPREHIEENKNAKQKIVEARA